MLKSGEYGYDAGQGKVKVKKANKKGCTNTHNIAGCSPNTAFPRAILAAWNRKREVRDGVSLFSSVSALRIVRMIYLGGARRLG